MLSLGFNAGHRPVSFYSLFGIRNYWRRHKSVKARVSEEAPTMEGTSPTDGITEDSSGDGSIPYPVLVYHLQIPRDGESDPETVVLELDSGDSLLKQQLEQPPMNSGVGDILVSSEPMPNPSFGNERSVIQFFAAPASSSSIEDDETLYEIQGSVESCNVNELISTAVEYMKPEDIPTPPAENVAYVNNLLPLTGTSVVRSCGSTLADGSAFQFYMQGGDMKVSSGSSTQASSRSRQAGLNRRTKRPPMSLTKQSRQASRPQNHSRRPQRTSPPLPRIQTPNYIKMRELLHCNCISCNEIRFMDPTTAAIRLESILQSGIFYGARLPPQNVRMGLTGFGSLGYSVQQESSVWDLSGRASSHDGLVWASTVAPSVVGPVRGRLMAYSLGKWTLATYRCELCGKGEASSWDMHCHRWEHPYEKLKYTEINPKTGLVIMRHDCPFIPSVEKNLSGINPQPWAS